MAKLITFLENGEAVAAVTGELAQAGPADYQIICLTDNYEYDIRQEVFLFKYEALFIALSALVGLIVGGAAMYAYSLGLLNFPVFAPFLAGGTPAAVFVGAGVGSALGALLGGLWGLSRPLDNSFSQLIMLVLYCRSDLKARAIDIVKKHGAAFI